MITNVKYFLKLMTILNPDKKGLSELAIEGGYR